MDSSANLSGGEELNTAICPLCGGPNFCAMATNPSPTACWCESLVIPSELLAQIPEDAVRKRCVCQKCLAEFQETT